MRFWKRSTSWKAWSCWQIFEKIQWKRYRMAMCQWSWQGPSLVLGREKEQGPKVLLKKSRTKNSSPPLPVTPIRRGVSTDWTITEGRKWTGWIRPESLESFSVVAEGKRQSPKDILWAKELGIDADIYLTLNARIVKFWKSDTPGSWTIGPTL